MMTMFPGLPSLELPPWLPGERLHEHVWGRDILYYLPDGRPISGDPIAALNMYAAIRSARGSHHNTFFYRAGVEIRVSTVYLGINLSLGSSGPPIVWESMVSVGGRWEDFRARYATSNAALRGHRLIAAHIRQSQRRRRATDAALAPSRSAERATRAVLAMASGWI